MAHIGVCLLAASMWLLMQDKRGLKRALLKLRTVRLRLGIGVVLGGATTMMFFAPYITGSTYVQVVNANRDRLASLTERFATECQFKTGAAHASNQPLSPHRPGLSFASSNPREATFRPSYAAAPWQGSGTKNNKHPTLNMSTGISLALYRLHQKNPPDSVLSSSGKAALSRASLRLRTGYFTIRGRAKHHRPIPLIVPANAQQAATVNPRMQAALYDQRTNTVVRHVVVECAPRETETRKRLLSALSEATGGRFTTDW